MYLVLSFDLGFGPPPFLFHSIIDLWIDFQTRHQGSSFLSELKQGLLLSQNEAAQAGTRYNVPLINSLVLYVGMQVMSLLYVMVYYLSILFNDFHHRF